MAGNLSSPKILITGGSGYLAPRLGAFLASQGYEVCLGTRTPDATNEIEGCSQILTDWSNSKYEFCNGFDLIIHAAGINAADCAKDPVMALKFNGETTGEFARRASLYGCTHFIYLSTVHVYKSPLTGTFDEQSQTVNNHPYATSHVYGEKQVLQVAKTSSLSSTVLRLSNSFGFPLTDNTDCWNLVVNEFIRDAFILGRIVIKGDYLTCRDFLPISELTNVLVQIVKQHDALPEVMNIASGQARSLLDVANQVRYLVSDFTGKNVEIVKENQRAKKSTLNIRSLALERLGVFFRPDLDSEIMRTLEYLRHKIEHDKVDPNNFYKY